MKKENGFKTFCLNPIDFITVSMNKQKLSEHKIN